MKFIDLTSSHPIDMALAWFLEPVGPTTAKLLEAMPDPTTPADQELAWRRDAFEVALDEVPRDQAKVNRLRRSVEELNRKLQ
jgi:hypothetical protein